MSLIERLPLELFISIADRLDMPDLLALSGTSRRNRTSTHYYIHHIVHRLLGQYMPNPYRFNNTMANTGALIGGTTALQFLQRKPTGNHGLNVFVSANRVHRLIAELRYQGFSLLPTTPPTRPTLLSGICGILRYQRNIGTSSVNLMLTAQEDVLIAFARSSTTATMTYVGPHAIHTVYPRLTFSKRALIPRQPYHDEESQAAKRRPDNYDGIVGVQMNRLLADGFDVQYYCAWDPLPCGDACGVAQNSIQSRTAFHLSYSQPLGNDFPGHNIRFVLRTECRNMFCDNFEDVMLIGTP